MNRSIPYIVISVISFILLPNIVSSQINSPRGETATLTDSALIKYGALAIDRSDGIYYGLGLDYSTLAEAEKNAIEECNKKGGKGSIVLSFSGTCCVAYRFIEGNVGMGYGWGIGLTKEEADKIAMKECGERSYYLPAPNHEIKCSRQNAGELKVIYDAHDELKMILPGTITDY
jgi:hypothetical protein